MRSSGFSQPQRGANISSPGFSPPRLRPGMKGATAVTVLAERNVAAAPSDVCWFICIIYVHIYIYTYKVLLQSSS